jgi:hypothetical protein
MPPAQDPFQQITQVWWCIPVTPAKQEAEIGGSQSDAGLDKNTRSYLKKNTTSHVVE